MQAVTKAAWKADVRVVSAAMPQQAFQFQLVEFTCCVCHQFN